MKHFSAQYTITNSGPPLKRAVLITEDDGTIVSIEDTEGDLKEKYSTEFHNGIIIPGFVNCHCHLELSHLKDNAPEREGLGGFIEHIRNIREHKKEEIFSGMCAADKQMYDNGIVLCADICNTSGSFALKKESRIKYINLLEVFGLDPEKAFKRFEEVAGIAQKAKEMDLDYSIVPHSVYSMSLTLFRLLRIESAGNKVTSVHYMESAEEEDFIKNRTGSLMSSYRRSGLLPFRLETVMSHKDAVLNEITRSGNLILVHNTFADRSTIRKVKERERLFWCLCPNSNIRIENKIPPLSLLLEEGCDLVIGTDSLASNSCLSILEELKTLQSNFPEITLRELISWATLNGANALDKADEFGKIETGMKPGLLLLQNIDLQNMKLLPESFVTRLI
jgi:cytosine/adenosine deaminase-related metal-dependent hydrolase